MSRILKELANVKPADLKHAVSLLKAFCQGANDDAEVLLDVNIDGLIHCFAPLLFQ